MSARNKRSIYYTGNPPEKTEQSFVENSFKVKGVFYSQIQIRRQPDPGDLKAEREWRVGAGSLPGARHEYCDVLKVARQVWRDGCFNDEASKRSRGRE